MPLKEGSSNKIVSENIKEMQASGHSHAQSIAAALHNAGKSYKDKKKKAEKSMEKSSKSSAPIAKGHSVHVNVSGEAKPDGTGTGHEAVKTHMATPELPKASPAPHSAHKVEGVVAEGNNAVAGPDPKVAGGGDKGKSLKAGASHLSKMLSAVKKPQVF